MGNRLLWFLAGLALTVFASTTVANEHRLGNLVIENPHIRSAPPGAPVSAGYLVVRNTGTTPDRMIGVRADFSHKAEIHEMKMEAGVMKMRPLVNGIEIPAGGSVALKPGGRHLMFMKPNRTLEKGTVQDVTLRFEKAGEIAIRMPVVDPANLNQESSEGSHSGHENHSN